MTMFRFVPLALLLTCLSAAAAAGASQIEVRTEPASGLHQIPRIPVQPETVGEGIVDSEADPTLAALPMRREGTVLNCENDNTIDLANTLVIDAGDMAGTIFAVPPDPRPYRVTSVSLGLVNFHGQTFPATVGLDVFEDDLAGNFEPVISLDIPIDAVADGGEIFEIDVTEFDIQISNDLLLIYGDINPVGQCGPANCDDLQALLPTGDASPRCFEQAGNDVCSVHLPASCPPDPDPCPTLFIYGVVDAQTCFRTEHNILSFDVVMDVTIEKIPVAAEATSWSAVKARY